MKKTFLILLFLPIFLFAGLDMAQVNKVLSTLSANKDLTFYTTEKKIKSKTQLKFTSSTKADILLLSKKSTKNKLAIVDSYKALKNNKNNIGAIYVRKGRTQIVFIADRLARNGLKLAPKMKKHLIHSWQLDPIALLKNIK